MCTENHFFVAGFKDKKDKKEEKEVRTPAEDLACINLMIDIVEVLRILSQDRFSKYMPVRCRLHCLHTPCRCSHPLLWRRCTGSVMPRATNAQYEQ